MHGSFLCNNLFFSRMNMLRETGWDIVWNCQISTVTCTTSFVLRRWQVEGHLLSDLTVFEIFKILKGLEN